MRWVLALLALFCFSVSFGQVKVKAHVTRDKSKPIRRGIGAWYEKNIDAFVTG